jgi:hypothetical protein
MTEPVIVVSGLPRSGTSMMMQLLATGGVVPLTDNLRQADEDNPRGYYEFERVKRLSQDSSWVAEAHGRVVKMVYRLLYDLPKGHDYRVVFMLRNLDEVIASQEVMLERLGKVDESVSRERLKSLYQRQLDDVRDWLSRQPNFSVLYVQYRDVLDDPQTVVADLNRFLGGTLDTEAMLRVPDPSLYRQRTVTPSGA